jgi:hypothetical protein
MSIPTQTTNNQPFTSGVTMRIVTFWISADGQSALDMTGLTESEALTELLAQCSDDGQRAAIRAGSFRYQE